MRYSFPAHGYSLMRPSLREQEYMQVQQILDGEVQLWDTLRQEAYPRVVESARRIDWERRLSYADYEDIADAAFALCFEGLKRFNGTSRFYYWVSGYAKNLTRRRLEREVTRRRNQYLLEFAARDAVIGSDPQHILLRLERYRCLWRAFFDLCAVDRSIVAQRVFYGTPFRNLAEDWNLTRGEVIRRHREALDITRLRFLHYFGGAE